MTALSLARTLHTSSSQHQQTTSKSRSNAESARTADGPLAREARLRELEQGGLKPPEPLKRAPGSQHKPDPRRRHLTLRERADEFVDEANRLKERKTIVREVAKGYFHDYHVLRHHGGKTWIAPNTLIRDDVARYFPDVEASSLAGENVWTGDLLKDKVSLVALQSFRSAEDHTKSFTRVIREEIDTAEHSNFQHVVLNVQENALKKLLVGMFMAGLRRSVPASEHATYLLARSGTGGGGRLLERLREPLLLANKHVGYVYLTDGQGRIRWAGCAFASPDEQKALVRCTRVLLEREREAKA